MAGRDVTIDPRSAQRLFGYCPQFDALFDLLTGREHLRMYAAIKGIPAKLVDAAVNSKITEMSLEKHADRLAGSYSGGNKRKLSVAVATIGAPPIVFLDEPSTGMDPVSRRFMWDVIARLASNQGPNATSIVLTTHSMEECEALCSRMAIMVDGRLRCLGSAQHLKTRYGSGLQLELNLALPSTSQLTDAAQSLFTQDAAPQLDDFVDALGVRVAMSNVANTEALLKQFSPEGSAALLHQRLQQQEQHLDSSGSGVTKRAVCEWFVEERGAASIEEMLREGFDGVDLKERQGARLRYSVVPRAGTALADAFGIIERARSRLGCIASYSLGQTSLEQVFNQFAASQEAELT